MIATPGGAWFDGPPAAVPTLDRVLGEAATCVGRSPAGIRVMVAPDWLLNCDSTRQMLPTRALGQDPGKAGWFHGPECDGAAWHLQALYQGDGLVVTPPSFYDLKDPVVRLLEGGMTAGDLWWGRPDLAACAASSTDPLQTW